jgi:hypothetical protein
VTVDTVIPSIPEKQITAPDEAAFHKKQVEIDDKIKEVFKSLDEKKLRFQSLIEQKNG